MPDPIRLHLGCGPNHMDGWVNIDNAKYPGVDRVLDLTKGLPYKDAQFIYAEHFIEHIPWPDAVKLLRECRRTLRDDGVLRLSTPNLDWVWMTHYKPAMTDEESITAAYSLNRAFRGWGHQFLYNETTLKATLAEAGFSEFTRCEYGISTHPALNAIERHELSAAYGSLSSILIIEAKGRGGVFPEHGKQIRDEFLRDIGVK